MTISLNLSDRVVDLAGEGFDCAVRVGDLPDSSLVSVRLADNRRLCVATPRYLQAARHAAASRTTWSKFDCLTLSSDASQTRGWAFRVAARPRATRSSTSSRAARWIAPTARCCTTGAWPGCGIAWRSTWEVESEIAAGRLVEVLADFAAPPNGIYAVFPQRKHLPLRVRLWIDFLKHNYSQPRVLEATTCHDRSKPCLPMPTCSPS